jgi:hypothetical protein
VPPLLSCVVRPQKGDNLVKLVHPGVSALVVLVLSASPHLLAQAKKGPALKDDLKALAGEWRTGEKAPAKVECSFDPGSDVIRPRAGVKIVVGAKEDWHGQVPLDLKEQDGKRYLVLDPAVEKISGLPRRWRYTLDKDSLTLTAEDGKYKGEYKLERAKKE